MLELVCDAGVNYGRTGFGWCIIDKKNKTIEVKHHFYSKTVNTEIAEFIAIAMCYSDTVSRYRSKNIKIYTDNLPAHNYLMFTGVKLLGGQSSKKNEDISNLLGEIKNILRNENVDVTYYKNGGKITILTHQICHNLASLNTMDAIDKSPDPNDQKNMDRYNTFINSTKEIIEKLKEKKFNVI